MRGVKGIDVAGMERLSGGSAIGGIAGWLLARLARQAAHASRGSSFWNGSRWRRGSRWRWSRPKDGGFWWRLRPRAGRRFIRSTESVPWRDSADGRTRNGTYRRASAAEGLMVAAWPAGMISMAAAAPAHVPLVARSEREAASLGLDAVDDSLCSDADHAAARDPDGHDAAGAAAGGLSLSAPGAGHADRALESHADGAGADDDVVPDDAGAESGRSAGRRALPRRRRLRAWRRSTAARSR